MSDGRQLFAEYVRNGSETAFRELVARYVDMVHSAAVRLVDGDTHLAQDITQTVFIDLARMARTLSRDVMLGGWLHRHTCFVASNTMRGERRRQSRERQAVEMNALQDHSEANLKVIAPILDEAIDELGAEDRAAIVLRFFEQHDFRSIGEALGSSEEAARKRVTRAVEKLHSLITRRGITASATALGTILAAEMVYSAPAGLAASASNAALAGAATATIGNATALTLFNIITMTKLNLSLLTVVILASLATGTWMIRDRSSRSATSVVAAARNDVPQTNFPKSSWTFAGYADPVSALVTTLWAGSESKGDVTLASLSPELQEQLKNRFSGQLQANNISLEEFLTLSSQRRVSSITGFRVLDQEAVSEDQVVLHLYVEGKEREDSFKMRRIGTEWKMADFPPDY